MHVVRPARARYELDSELFTPRGTVAATDVAVAQRVAHNMNVVRDAPRFPELAVATGELFAAALIDEILRTVIRAYRERHEPNLLAKAIAHLGDRLGTGELEALLTDFTSHFPPLAVYRDGAEVAEYLGAESDGEPHRNVTLEELLIVRLGNENPANTRFRELFDDAPLEARKAYEQAIAELESFFAASLPDAGSAGGSTSLLDVLRAPARNSPTSLEGQLQFIRDHWGDLLGDRFADVLERILRASDLLVEERKEGGLGFGPPPVLDAQALRGTGEYERFSADSSWMPRVVLMAKSTYVWLHQLSRDYGRSIERLDQVPDEELDRLADCGITGLWLIGLWERSSASRTIKHMRGDPDAVASAYALYDYAIAADLGGDTAYEDLRNRAGQRAIRLASDMVPNHVGIDGRWVIEHPDWFLALPEPPYPAYTFTGPDLSQDGRVTIQIEDHYWDGTDAAVVFRRHDHGTGDTRYIYHGNDGTAMPWNDTAQLNYLDAEVREGVIQTILHVARKFPIIRFDAAMTLAKRHVRRLWFPAPGEGGAIPSRAQHGMTIEEFDAAMPEEFWREVVDRVAEEVPDTLLLAEAFWMMEGYFVRTLGMHRVYNSAFMHMLAEERNGEYRQTVRNILEFDPEILKRFVNFMNNPDEETAVAQFGKDGKYFGVATVMATMPGLPMFGHGQIEGYAEKYGMEFRRPRQDEYPDEGLVDRHRREIFPLLHRRAQFAEVADFALYDVVAPEGHVNEDVFAYSNRHDGAGALVLFHNKWGDAIGHIHTSVPYRDKGAGAVRTRTVAEALGLRAGDGDWLVYRQHPAGVEHVLRARDVADRGLEVQLGAFEYQVLLDFREVADPSGEYARVAERLAGRGAVSIADELEALRLEPLHQAIAGFVAAAAADSFADAVPGALRALAAAARERGDEVDVDAKRLVPALTRASGTAGLGPEQAGRLAPGGWRRALLAARAVRERVDPSRRPDPAIREGFDAAGLDPPAPPLFDVLATPIDAPVTGGRRRPPARTAVRRLLSAWSGNDAARAALGVNTYEGEEWFDRDRYRALVSGIAAVGLAGAARKRERDRLARVLAELLGAEDGCEYRWDRLTSG